MRKILLPSAVALLAAAPSATAAEWKSVGPISTPGQGATILSAGIDGQGVFTALFRDIDIDDEAGPLQERDRGPGGRLVAGPPFAEADAGLPTLAVAPGGGRIAAYAAGSAGSERVEVSTRVPGGSWSDPQVVADGQRSVQQIQVRQAPSGDVIVSWIDWLNRGASGATDTELRAAVRPAGASRFDAPQLVERGNIFFDHELAVDAAGDAALAYVELNSRTLHVARRPAGGSFGAPGVVTTPDNAVVEARDVGLDAAPGGRAIVTWRVGPFGSAGNGVAVATGTLTGGFGPGRTLSTSASGIGAQADDDLAAVTWVDRPGAQGRVKALLLPDGAGLATAPVRVLSGTAVPYGFGELVVSHGRATFAWVRRVAGPRVVEARSATARGRFTRTQTLSSRSDTSSNIQILASSRGEPWVAWNGQSRPDLRIDTTATAKASSRTGIFGRTVRLARGPGGLDLLQLYPGVDGTMLAAYRRGYWYLRVYGER